MPDRRVLLVSYDLKGAPAESYEALFEALKANPGWWHYLESTWLLVTDRTSVQLAEQLRPHLDQNDRLLVIEVVPRYSGWLPQKAWEWMRRQMA